MKMITLWSLYNSNDKIQIDDLKTEQVRVILLSIPTSRMKDWMICKKGTLHWQSLMENPEFYEDVRDLKGDSGQINAETFQSPQKGSAQKPSPNQRRPLFEDIDLDSEETLSLMGSTQQKEVKERRSARRHHKNLTFTVIQGGKTFETETQDISMAGVSIEDALPEWAKDEFGASMSFKNDKVKVRVARVHDDKTGTKLKIIAADHWDVLRSWVSGW